MLADSYIDRFLSEHILPATYRTHVTQHFIPLAKWIISKKKPAKPLVVGLNGAQGTGKSTLAVLLQLILSKETDWNVVVLSIDDYYFTLEERVQLARSLHPLLETRGVPGTHDVDLLLSTIRKLQVLEQGQSLTMPQFDKAQDDRSQQSFWPQVTGPVDVILLEGWCVGSRPQAANELDTPVNKLEEDEDTKGIWRRYVNHHLQNEYARLFQKLDALILLKAPDFESVYHWRLLQEKKLAEKAINDDNRVMDEEGIAYFIQHYERLTRWNLQSLPALADVILELNTNHQIINSIYQDI